MEDSQNVPVEKSGGSEVQGPSHSKTQASSEPFKVEIVPREQSWKGYEDSKYDSPVFNRLAPYPVFYYYRWKVLSIFHSRLFFDVVLGEVLFFLLLIGGLAVALGIIGAQDGRSTGRIACVAPALTFAFACRNSIWILFTGLPFERALIWHKICAYLSVLVGAWHGYVTNSVDLSAVIGVSFWHGAVEIAYGLTPWVLDVLLRAAVIICNYRKRKQVLAVRLPSNVVRLTFLKEGFQYKAGQYCFICVPGVTWFEWHPFSLSSSPHENKVSFHIRILGDWTQKLYDHIDTVKMITVFIDGPYGTPCLDIDGSKYKHFLLVSGGIGITPMQSICNDLLYQRRRGRDLKKVMFVWSVRDLYMVTSVLQYDQECFHKNSDLRLPYSFSPDLLDRSTPEEILETYFHLTRERNTSKFTEGNIRPEIQPTLKFGRPELPVLFEKMKRYCQDGNNRRVAVLACGPRPLVDSVQTLCAKYSCRDVIFDFHKEVFEF
ncbi:Cytochrome b-245 heavy chain [Exaiptasia diaphana]|nr:Cytochrome b-245 heavy chain [Exaiptasia diaphana]